VSISSLAQTSLAKSVRLSHVRDVIMYVCPLLVACSRGGLISEPQRLKPQIFLYSYGAAEAAPFQSSVTLARVLP
jgi:hypothetical protein